MKNETKNTKMNTDFFNYTLFTKWDDEIDQAKEAYVGIVKDGRFTGIAEWGGKYAAMLYFVKGTEVTNNFDSEEEREEAVLSSIEGLEEYYKQNKDLYVDWDDGICQPVRRADLYADKINYYFTLDMVDEIGNYTDGVQLMFGLGA